MLRVLIVEDEAAQRKGVALGVDWAKLDCVVVGEAANGEEGMALATQLQPGLIITDIRMPRMDGIAMMNALRQQGCKARVIVLTAYSDFSYARSALLFQADDYLLKPFREAELAAAVMKVCAQSVDPIALEQPLPQSAPEQSRYVQATIRYIAEHYADAGMGITSIASDLAVSEGHLSHVFKKETGYTITSYLARYRVHVAMELLKDCRQKVYEVAEKVGYHDVAYFGSVFKKQTGLTPSEYQNKG